MIYPTDQYPLLFPVAMLLLGALSLQTDETPPNNHDHFEVPHRRRRSANAATGSERSFPGVESLRPDSGKTSGGSECRVTVEEGGLGHLPVVVSFQAPVLQHHRLSVLTDVGRLLDSGSRTVGLSSSTSPGSMSSSGRNTFSGAGRPWSRAYSTRYRTVAGPPVRDSR